MKKREQKLPIYKYKTPDMNSIDVFITFQRSFDTGNYIDVFDNTLPNIIEAQDFRLVNLKVGNSIGNKEVPELFLPEQDNHEAFFPVKNNFITDVKGNMVQDNTVVEVVYNNNPNIPHKYRWKILRTRWDKTESVRKFGTKYGNFKTTVARIWKSIKEAVTMEEIVNLSNPDMYDSQMSILRSRIDSSVVTSERKQDVYYQKISNLCKEMRSFIIGLNQLLFILIVGLKSKIKSSFRFWLWKRWRYFKNVSF